MIHAFATLAGVGILGATAHTTVQATGGYSSEHAPVVLAVAIGVAVGAICIGRAFREHRFALGAAMVLCLVAGESYGLLSTAERIIAAREARQVPVTASAARRLAALDRVAAAERAKAAADTAALTKASEKGCAANCRQILESTQHAAQREGLSVSDQRRAVEPGARGVDAVRERWRGHVMLPALSASRRRTGTPPRPASGERRPATACAWMS